MCGARNPVGVGATVGISGFGEVRAGRCAIGYALAAGAFFITVFLLGNKRFPAALPVVLLGVVYAVAFGPSGDLWGSFGFALPAVHVPRMQDILTGFVVLTLSQIPLSLSNSVLATRQLAEDLFPERQLTIRKIGLTYALMNLINPWFGGVPTCHGSGGMAGHFAFGGRTGGSVVIYGLLFVTLGLFFGAGFDRVVKIFPQPILGVILLFESLGLVWLARDTAPSRTEFPITVLVGLLAVGLPYGFVTGILVGTGLFYRGERVRLVSPDAV
ncbi:MAG: putative sulfate/molybdate transporter [Armatimonadota bacterium]